MAYLLVGVDLSSEFFALLSVVVGGFADSVEFTSAESGEATIVPPAALFACDGVP